MAVKMELWRQNYDALDLTVDFRQGLGPKNHS